METTKLSLKKETITKLNNDQMKQFIGGLIEDGPSSQSCNRRSCDSKSDAGSCDKYSCNCPNGSIDPSLD